MSISTGKALLHALIPFGPMKLRINELNGSADHMWTLFPLFQLPPFSLVPTLMMKSGAIKKGKLKGRPYDGFILLAIVLRFLVGFISEKLDEPWATVITVMINLLAVMLPFIIRIYSPFCNLCKSNINQGFDVIIKIFSSSAIIMAIIEALTIGLSYVPYIGAIPSLIEMIPIVGPLLLYGIYFIPLYIFTNIRRENNLSKFCNEKVNKIGRMLATIAPIVIFVIIQKIGNFDPTAIAEDYDDE